MPCEIPMRLLFLCLLLAAWPFSGHAEEYEKCSDTHERPIAIFIEPTDAEIASMKEEHGQEDFYVIADDSLYYQWQATEFFEKKKFHFCFTENEKHSFLFDNKPKLTLNVDCQGWCLILWNGRDEPISTTAVDLFMHESYLESAK